MSLIRKFINRFCIFLALTLTSGSLAAPVSLFDGKTLEGWEGETAKTWRGRGGGSVGGAGGGNPRNACPAQRKRYPNLVLRGDYEMVGEEGCTKGGITGRRLR